MSRIRISEEELSTDVAVIGGGGAGIDTCGWESGSYGGAKLPGSALGFAINSGRIAGENAAKYIS